MYMFLISSRTKQILKHILDGPVWLLNEFGHDVFISVHISKLMQTPDELISPEIYTFTMFQLEKLF
jgi:hypothetical protein